LNGLFNFFLLQKVGCKQNRECKTDDPQPSTSDDTVIDSGPNITSNPQTETKLDSSPEKTSSSIVVEVHQAATTVNLKPAKVAKTKRLSAGAQQTMVRFLHATSESEYEFDSRGY
jgi:hypothetical protein